MDRWASFAIGPNLEWNIRHGLQSNLLGTATIPKVISKLVSLCGLSSPIDPWKIAMGHT